MNFIKFILSLLISVTINFYKILKILYFDKIKITHLKKCVKLHI